MNSTPSHGPYYESRYIRANNPRRPQALWLRETLLLTRAGDASADVWVMVFDPDGYGLRTVKRPHPMAAADFRNDQWTVRIGSTFLDDRCARGSLTGPTAASWDLRIDTSGQAPVTLLTDRGYRARFPTAKTMVRSPLARIDGRVTVQDASVEVDGWTGSVNHNWGRRHTPEYAYGQVCGFDGRPDTTLEIVTARAGLGPVLLPRVTLLVLRHAGHEFAVRSVFAASRTRGDYRPFSWSFGARTRGTRLAGELTAEPADIIGLTYTDTDGASKYCYNSALATCRLRLSGPVTGDVELTAARRAMLEILTDKRREDVPLLA